MPLTPRIAIDDFPGPLADRLRPRVERLGYLGEFFSVAAHQPAALSAFIDYTQALRQDLPVRLTEIIALTVAALTANDYERVQHERLALTSGMDLDEIRALVGGRAPAENFTAVERAAHALATDVVAARGRSCAGAFEQLEELAGAATAVGSLMTAVRYLAHATMANTWGLTAPVDSPLTQVGDA